MNWMRCVQNHLCLLNDWIVTKIWKWPLTMFKPCVFLWGQNGNHLAWWSIHKYTSSDCMVVFCVFLLRLKFFQTKRNTCSLAGGLQEQAHDGYLQSCFVNKTTKKNRKTYAIPACVHIQSDFWSLSVWTLWDVNCWCSCLEVNVFVHLCGEHTCNILTVLELQVFPT